MCQAVLNERGARDTQPRNGAAVPRLCYLTRFKRRKTCDASTEPGVLRSTTPSVDSDLATGASRKPHVAPLHRMPIMALVGDADRKKNKVQVAPLHDMLFFCLGTGYHIRATGNAHICHGTESGKEASASVATQPNDR